jgi:thioredoxin-related protein
VNFTGSDWCPPCIQLKRDALSQRRFLEFAETNLVLLEIDFPQRTPLPQALARQNDELHSRFLISGFPTLVLLDPGGRELGRHIGYLPGGPEALVRWVSKERN